MPWLKTGLFGLWNLQLLAVDPEENTVFGYFFSQQIIICLFSMCPGTGETKTNAKYSKEL